MPTYEIHFTGRKLNAIGVFYPITAYRKAETPEAAVLALYNEYEHISCPKCKPMRVRYAPTFVNKDGTRTLMCANQGRNHFDTREAAEEWLAAVTANNSPEQIESIWGKNAAGTFAVREVECYDHGDAIGIYFDE